jgi:predicted nucleic acid-binding protein
MRVTLDTAILIRTNAKATGSARELLDALKCAGAVLVLPPFTLAEVERALRYPRVQSICRMQTFKSTSRICKSSRR